MRKLIVLAAFLLPATALAIPCPKGKNVRLQDTTTASTVAQQQAQQQANSNSGGSNTTQSVSLRNHYPH